MRRTLLVMALAAATAASAQKIADPRPFANTITPDDLKKHLYIVAGPAMEGRETATEGQRKAAAYIESQFKALGLLAGNKGNFQLGFPIYQDSLNKAAIEVNGKPFTLYNDFTISMMMAHTNTVFGSEVVFVGNGIIDSTHNDFKGVAGKIVLIIQPPSSSTGGGTRVGKRDGLVPYAIMEAAQKNGAAAVLIAQTNFTRRSNTSRVKGPAYLDGFQKSIDPNTYYISEEIAKAIMGADFDAAREALKTGNAQPKSYMANVMLEFRKDRIELASSNVVGFLEGSDKKEEFVFITAHYDHLGKRGDSVIYYGADDDGSGTVSVLELAEAFAKAKAAGKGPRRSIVFMTVSGEEKGLWGSEFYSDHPLYPLEKTTVDLNIDMIGRIDPKRKEGDSTNYVYVVGDDKLSSDLRPISEAMNKKYTKLELDYKYNAPKDPERIYYRSDHYNFARKGVPIIFYFNGTHNDYHRPSDTPDKINYNLMAKRAQLVFYTAWEMANRNEMLKRDIPLSEQ
ncbi:MULTISPECIES: M28 family peptidase [Niastella]|uniref:M28 family peptidase n=1 Tax=Niastella soli TaxID=2821487 RepID=A0ABS3YY47_9BACT|nr:M28 family peptidase [Niastella soli]MBO9202749.1 M28 family peptidase [Niastella soli]